MTTIDGASALALLALVLRGQCRRADWLAIADALEEAGQTYLAGDVRSGLDESWRGHAANEWAANVAATMATNDIPARVAVRVTIERMLEYMPALVAKVIEELEAK